MEQHFQFGDRMERFDVRHEANGNYFGQLDDIQDIFSEVTRFQVDGKAILFLLDERGKWYEATVADN
ncbi:hypothetical protein BGZ52_001232, partial [Haplosporangium bisporale]